MWFNCHNIIIVIVQYNIIKQQYNIPTLYIIYIPTTFLLYYIDFFFKSEFFAFL